MNYGSKDELLRAIKQITKDVQDNKYSIDEISEEHVSQNLFTSNTPDPDLLIRTSGEQEFQTFYFWSNCLYVNSCLLKWHGRTLLKKNFTRHY